MVETFYELRMADGGCYCRALANYLGGSTEGRYPVESRRNVVQSTRSKTGSQKSDALKCFGPAW